MPVFRFENVVYRLNLLSIYSILILTRPLVFLPFAKFLVPLAAAAVAVVPLPVPPPALLLLVVFCDDEVPVAAEFPDADKFVVE